MKKMLALIVASFLLICACGGAKSINILPAVHAGTPDCTPEYFFDAASPAAIETKNTLWFATNACVIETAVSETYVTTLPHNVQRFTIQMGSNQGSQFEWDQVITVIDPSGSVLLMQQQQYDKHIDDHGNRQETYLNSTPVFVPAGSTVKIVRRPSPATSCIKGGPYGDRQDECVTGGSLQWQDVVK